MSIINAPGHRIFTGISGADHAVLMAAVGVAQFEDARSKNADSRTTSMPFGLNMRYKTANSSMKKMDSTEPPYSQERCEETVKEVITHVKEIGSDSLEKCSTGRALDALSEDLGSIPSTQNVAFNYP